jgi:hypothetical protein
MHSNKNKEKRSQLYLIIHIVFVKFCITKKGVVESVDG